MKLNKYKQFLKENIQFNYASVGEYLAEPGVHWGNVQGNYVGKFENKNYEQIMTNHQNWLSGLREDFAESIKNCAMGRSYSDLCKTKQDPSKDFDQIQKELEDDCGWNLESIKNLFSSEIDAITFQQFQDFINSYDLDRNNGMTDVYLYILAEKLGQNSEMVELGGSGWCEYATEEDEILIRYSYGYHHTKYGELMLKQIGMTRENFVEKSLSRVKEQLINYLDELQKISIDDFFLADFDRMIISVNDLLDEIHNYGIESGDRKFSEMNREDLLAMITKELSDIFGNVAFLNIKDTGNEIIIEDKK
jgi:hypothetical protein